jgi:hypothetical protein
MIFPMVYVHILCFERTQRLCKNDKGPHGDHGLSEERFCE